MTDTKLPELPAPDFMLRWDSMRAAYYVSRPNVGNTDVYTADQMRAYGELCRALVEVINRELDSINTYLDEAVERCAAMRQEGGGNG